MGTRKWLNSYLVLHFVQHASACAYLHASCKEMIDCMKPIQKMIGSFEYMVMTSHASRTNWPIAFQVAKQIIEFEKVNQVHASGVTLANCPEAHNLMSSVTNAMLIAITMDDNALSFQAQLAEIKVLMPMYTFASENFINDEFVRQNYITTTPYKVMVTLGGECEVDIQDQATLYVQKRAYWN